MVGSQHSETSGTLHAKIFILAFYTTQGNMIHRLSKLRDYPSGVNALNKIQLLILITRNMISKHNFLERSAPALLLI